MKTIDKALFVFYLVSLFLSYVAVAYIILHFVTKYW